MVKAGEISVDGSPSPSSFLLPPMEWEGWLLPDILIIGQRRICGCFGLRTATAVTHDQIVIVLQAHSKSTGITISINCLHLDFISQVQIQV